VFLSEIATFLVAGHGTTGTAMTWTLFGLCQNLEAQRKLREELLALPTDDPTMDELKALPYLDMVVRESLRLYTAFVCLDERGYQGHSLADEGWIFDRVRFTSMSQRPS
jgi:cytochrome P450